MKRATRNPSPEALAIAAELLEHDSEPGDNRNPEFRAQSMQRTALDIRELALWLRAELRELRQLRLAHAQREECEHAEALKREEAQSEWIRKKECFEMKRGARGSGVAK